MGNGAVSGIKRWAAALALSVSAFFPVACGSVTGLEEGSEGAARLGRQDTAGAVIISIALGSTALRKAASAGSKALAKKADTSITLDTLHLVLSSPGCDTHKVDLAVPGNINASSQVLTTKVHGLKSLRNWTIRAFTRDLEDTVMHDGSTAFYVKPGDTAAVSMTIIPKYSVLVARFLSTSNSVKQIKMLELRVDGAVVDDTVFASKIKLFDVRLSHKYLKAGSTNTVELRAYTGTGNGTLEYSRSVNISTVASQDSEVTVQLN